MTLQRLALAAALALAAFAAQAQTLTKPKEFYFDPDASTVRAIKAAEGEGEALAAQLVKLRARGRKQVEATAQLAHLAVGDKRVELGKSLYVAAVEDTTANGSLGRAVRWNYAWDLYRNDEFEPALALWSELVVGFGQPSWVPPTLALALWSTDRKTEAVKWYAAAVRTEPNLWSDPANYPALLPDWRAQDRERLAEVQKAWAANPPSWP
jgi:hypothetical protein